MLTHEPLSCVWLFSALQSKFSHFQPMIFTTSINSWKNERILKYQSYSKGRLWRFIKPCFFLDQKSFLIKMLIKWSILNDQQEFLLPKLWIVQSIFKIGDRSVVCPSMFPSDSLNTTRSYLAFFKWCPITNTWETLPCFTAAAAALAEVTYWAQWVAEWGQAADASHVIEKCFVRAE